MLIFSNVLSVTRSRRFGVVRLFAACVSAGCLSLALLAGTFGPAPAAAQLPGTRQLPPALTLAGRDWRSVGRLDIGASGFCTATLIADDLALTAAHCVTNLETGAAHPAERMQLRLGLNNARAEAVRGIRSVHRTGWSIDRSGDQSGGLMSQNAIARVPSDLAILVLDHPVRLPQIVPVRPDPAELAEGQALIVVSYARGRDSAAAIQNDCLLVERRSDGVLVLDCEVDHGASGAPVMQMHEGEPRVVAVISARGALARAGFPEATIALAAPLDGRIARDLLSIADRAASPPGAETAGARVRRLVDTTVDRPAAGPRFMRP